MLEQIVRMLVNDLIRINPLLSNLFKRSFCFSGSIWLPFSHQALIYF